MLILKDNKRNATLHLIDLAYMQVNPDKQEQISSSQHGTTYFGRTTDFKTRLESNIIALKHLQRDITDSKMPSL